MGFPLRVLLTIHRVELGSGFVVSLSCSKSSIVDNNRDPSLQGGNEVYGIRAQKPKKGAIRDHSLGI